MASFFVNRPIVAMVISIVIVILGLVSLKGLPIAQYPEIVPPEVQVSATYTGASAVDVEQSVATPIEQKVNGVEGMIYMRSINANDGSLSLRVSFEVGTDLDMANVLVQNRVSEATPSLPEEVKRLGVSVKKSLSFPLMLVTLRSPGGTYDNNFLSNYAAINVMDAIARIRGVGQVNLFGGSDYAMRVWVKPDQLAKLGLTVPDLIRAVQAQNVIIPAGEIGGPPAPPGTEFTYTVKTQGRLSSPEEFGAVVVRSNPDGSQVHLRDVARVELGVQRYNAVGRLNGDGAAVIAVYQTPGSNALQVADAIVAAMEEMKSQFPDDLEYVVSLDTTLSVREGIREIVQTLFEAIVLVILVVFIFLQNWRATVIPLLAVPVSLIGAFTLFPFLGFSVNNLSLLGLVLAIGIVVDDAIVVVEAVMHHMEKGLSSRDATLKAMQEVSGPVVATSLIMVAVFVPVAFMAGITGRLYQQFAITIAVSVIFSTINALTLSPALSVMMLKPGTMTRGPLGAFFGFFNRGFDKATGGYLGFTGHAVRKLGRCMILIAVLVVATGVLGKSVPTGFMPEEDQGYMLVNVILPDGASLERCDAAARKVEEILAGIEGIKSYTTVTGYSLLTQSLAPNTAFFFVELEPWEERPGKEGHVTGIIAKANGAFARSIPEAVVIAFGPPAIPGLGTGSGFSVMLQDRGGNTPDYLAAQTQKFIEAARARPEIGHIFTVYRTGAPQISADIDREKVYKLGVPLGDVNQALGAFLGGAYVNDFNRFGRLYKVYVQAEPEYRDAVEDMGFFFVRGGDGQMVSLNTIITTGQASGPSFTNRFNLFRAAEVSGAPAPGVSSAQAMAALEEVARQVLPADMSYEWNAMSYQEKVAQGSAGAVFLFALLMVFLILAAQYESWSLPFSVLLGTPFAVFGAFLGLWIMRFVSPSYVNNVFAQIGVVMLVGLAAKNAILIVEFARGQALEGKNAVEAAMEAARLRFRPILMTAFSFILGVIPLLIASGAGSEARKVMGMAVFAGMLVATVLAVVLIPVLFVMVDRVVNRKRSAPAEATPGGGGR